MRTEGNAGPKGPGLFGRPYLSGASDKAWLANGLDELRQVLHPSVQQVQPGNTPGLWGSPTTGEQTAERLGRDYEVPTREALYGPGREPAAPADQAPQPDRPRGRGR
ncbi:MAG: hypothetical protein C0501_26425 [Isosphaera sp.]|nr:hypothetical protein [Isosphaera sp.]